MQADTFMWTFLLGFNVLGLGLTYALTRRASFGNSLAIKLRALGVTRIAYGAHLGGVAAGAAFAALFPLRRSTLALEALSAPYFPRDQRDAELIATSASVMFSMLELPANHGPTPSAILTEFQRASRAGGRGMMSADLFVSTTLALLQPLLEGDSEQAKKIRQHMPTALRVLFALAVPEGVPEAHPHVLAGLLAAILLSKEHHPEFGFKRQPRAASEAVRVPFRDAATVYFGAELVRGSHACVPTRSDVSRCMHGSQWRRHVAVEYAFCWGALGLAGKHPNTERSSVQTPDDARQAFTYAMARTLTACASAGVMDLVAPTVDVDQMMLGWVQKHM